MSAVVDLFRYATGSGFWTFVGVAILLGIVTDGARSAVLTVFGTIHSTLKR